MSIIYLLVMLVIVGLVLYVVNALPIDALIKRIIYVIVIILILLWVLQAFGLLPAGSFRLR